jgi:Ca2+:H+ antiporter
LGLGIGTWYWDSLGSHPFHLRRRRSAAVTKSQGWTWNSIHSLARGPNWSREAVTTTYSSSLAALSKLLLIFVPAAILLSFLVPSSHMLIFLAACLAIIPLAGWLGRATEELAHNTNEGIGGLLNATFGNATELIIAVAALQRGLYSVVKASLTGSVIGNLLLVLGGAVLAGGIKHERQYFNVVVARAQVTLLTLASIGMIMPAAFHYLAGPGGRSREQDLSLEISLVLLLAYAAHLVFSLRTHKQLFARIPAEAGAVAWSVKKSILVLLVSRPGDNVSSWHTSNEHGTVWQLAHSLR